MRTLGTGICAIATVAAIVASPAAPAAEAAGELPSGPIRIVVPFAGGGGADLLARLVGERLAARMGRPVVIENIPGGANVLGMRAVATSPKDGRTLGLATPIFVTSSGNGYDAARDFAPVAMIGLSPLALVLSPKVPAASLEEFIRHARAAPGRLNYASLGPQTTQGLAAALFNRMAGIDAVEVPYKGSGPAVVDLLAGNVQYLFTGLASMIPYIESGRLRGLGVTSKARSPLLPALPAIGEALPGYEVTTWYALVAPSGTPGAVTGEPGLRERLAAHGVEARALDPAALSAFLAAESARLSKFSSEMKPASH